MIGTDDLPLFDEGKPWEDVQASLMALELGDGLPLVPPTRARIDRMLRGVKAPDASHGQVPPMFGELTAELVAYSCVLAGCEPAELPVVLTAVAASLQPEFNLLGIQTTTGTPTVAVIVHGPVAARLGMNSGTNCLGPGNRANACIGRAVRLCLTNIGGARPGVGDMATMGQPGKYGICFAEGAHPLVEPLHARRGLDAGDSAVTVLGCSGTMEVLPREGEDRPETVLEPMLAAMLGARDAANAGRTRPGGEQIFLLPPEMADRLVKHQWTLARVQDFMFRDALANGPGDIHPVIAGGAGVKMTYPPSWMGGTMSVTTALIEP